MRKRTKHISGLWGKKLNVSIMISIFLIQINKIILNFISHSWRDTLVSCDEEAILQDNLGDHLPWFRGSPDLSVLKLNTVSGKSGWLTTLLVHYCIINTSNHATSWCVMTLCYSHQSSQRLDFFPCRMGTKGGNTCPVSFTVLLFYIVTLRKDCYCYFLNLLYLVK